MNSQLLAVILITRDPEAREIIGNRAAHETLRMPQEVNQSSTHVWNVWRRPAFTTNSKQIQRYFPMLKNLVMAVAISSGCFAVAGASPGVGNAACGESVTVQQGDTIAQIASLCGVSVEDILRANPEVDNPDAIGQGTILQLGTTLPAQGPSATGDTEVGVERIDELIAQLTSFTNIIELAAAIEGVGEDPEVRVVPLTLLEGSAAELAELDSILEEHGPYHNAVRYWTASNLWVPLEQQGVHGWDDVVTMRVDGPNAVTIYVDDRDAGSRN